MRILVVDDEPFIRMINTRVLMLSGYSVDAAEDGEAAWQALNAESYDLLITDNTMPRVTGVELLKRLHAANMSVPVIMVTGTIPQAEFDRCPWIQPDATLLKPYTFEEFTATVKVVLRAACAAKEGVEAPANGRIQMSNA